MSEHFFNTEDGIIDPIPCLSDLTLYQDVSQESVKKEIRKSEEISDFDIQSLKVPDIRQFLAEPVQVSLRPVQALPGVVYFDVLYKSADRLSSD